MARSKNGKSKTKGPKKSTGRETSQQSPQRRSAQQQHKQQQRQQSQPEAQGKKIVPRGRSVICRVGDKSFKMNYKTLKEIKRLQKSTQFCIPKLPFSRLLRELVQQVDQRSEMRMNADAIVALQEAAEMFMVNVMEDANLCALHAKRMTVRPIDMNLVMELRRHS